MSKRLMRPARHVRRYTVLVHRDEGGFYVTVPALPGCFTQGATANEAVARAPEAIAAHLEALAKSGQPLPDEDAEPVTVASVEVESAA